MGHIGIRRGLYTIVCRFSTLAPAVPPLAVNRGNTEEIFGFKAGPADQGAIYL
jgi:hypothetical protein